MSTRYLLPCTCGKKIEVRATQSGLNVLCDCGRTLEVPTRRSLEQLDLAAPAVAQEKPAVAWGPRQGLVFLGTIVFLVAVGFGVYLWRTPPRDVREQTLREISPSDTLQFWQVFRQGIRTDTDPTMFFYLKSLEQYRFRVGIALVTAVVGLAIAIAGMLLKPKRGRRLSTAKVPPSS